MTTDAVLPISHAELDDILRMVHLLLGDDEAGPGCYITPRGFTHV